MREKTLTPEQEADARAFLIDTYNHAVESGHEEGISLAKQLADLSASGGGLGEYFARAFVRKAEEIRAFAVDGKVTNLVDIYAFLLGWSASVEAILQTADLMSAEQEKFDA